MKRWIPYPLTSVCVLIAWLLINQTVSLAHILLGGVIALFIPWLLRNLQPLPEPRFNNLWVLFRLLGMALVEIIRSCFNVSRIILLTKPSGVHSEFIKIPLDLKNPYGLAMLSCLINSTPGTVWVDVNEDTQELMLHVFDLHDEQWWVETIKTRYERPLMEIFEPEAIS